MIIPIVIFAYYKTGLVKATIISIVRMTVQLLLVAVYLETIFELNLWWINLLWALFMIFLAAGTITKRSNLPIKKFIIPIFISVLVSLILIDTFFLGIIIKLDNFFDARYFIPITGMILGNCLKTNIISLNSYYSGLQKESTLYKYYLANGATRSEALAPFMKEALRVAFNPVIANTAVIGLISLPGMMTGQILGGSDPSVAIKYQIMLLITIFVASILTVFLSIIITNQFTFDKYDRIKSEIFLKK